MTPTTATVDFKLHWSPSGKLVLTHPDGSQHEGVVPVRAFPISAAEEGLSLVDPGRRSAGFARARIYA
jgi:hypothetical protein